jgi:hypothetical protein
MSQVNAGRLDALPYYREYLEQILKPRVASVVEEIRVGLTDQIWAHLLQRIAQDQNPGAAADPQALQQLKNMLEQTLGLHLGVQLIAEFDGTPAVPGPTPTAVQPGKGEAGRDNVNVVDRTFPNNPLARAVGGVRRATP